MSKIPHFMVSIPPLMGKCVMKYAKQHKISPLQAIAHILHKPKNPKDPRSKLYYPHPGEVLKDEFMRSSKLSVSSLAGKLKVPPKQLGRLVAEKEPITRDLARRLAKFFHTTIKYWASMHFTTPPGVTRTAKRRQNIASFSCAINTALLALVHGRNPF